MTAHSLKPHFLLDPDVIFLNHGSFGACPRPVFENYQWWQRELERQPFSHPQLTPAQGDVLDPTAVASLVASHDAVISAISPGEDPHTFVAAAHSLLDGLKQAGVKRLLIVGGAGSLEVASGVDLLDTPEFPAAVRPFAQGHHDALAVYRASSGVDWTFLSPADRFQPFDAHRTATIRQCAEDVNKAR